MYAVGSGIALRVAVVVVLDLGSGVSGRIQARWSLTIIMKAISIFVMDRTDIMRTSYGSVRKDGPSLQSYQSFHEI